MAIELKLYYPIASAVPFYDNLHLFLSAINYLLGFVFENNMFWGHRLFLLLYYCIHLFLSCIQALSVFRARLARMVCLENTRFILVRAECPYVEFVTAAHVTSTESS